VDYHLYRNNLLVLTRLYPLSLLAMHLPLKIGSLLVAAIRRGSIIQYVRALANVLWAFPGTLISRTPVSRSVVLKHLRQSRQWVAISSNEQLSASSQAV
jgi:hypothetical protein